MKDPNGKDTNLQDRLGLDEDEQEMNGLYGMAETKEEDVRHNSNTQLKQ
ncbi:DUF4021 domain-containing protein [Niallia circulans]